MQLFSGLGQGFRSSLWCKKLRRYWMLALLNFPKGTLSNRAGYLILDEARDVFFCSIQHPRPARLKAKPTRRPRLRESNGGQAASSITSSQARSGLSLFVTVHGFRVQRLRVHRKPACHPCPQYGRRASGRGEL